VTAKLKRKPGSTKKKLTKINRKVFFIGINQAIRRNREHIKGYSRLPMTFSTSSRISQDWTSAFMALWSG